MYLADWQIQELINEADKLPSPMDSRFYIKGFEPSFEVSYTESGVKKPSAGLSPHGYDCRLSTRFHGMDGAFEAEDLILNPGESVLGSTVEYIKLPADITGTVEGKSTYARQFLMCVVTPLEAGWQGHVTLELVNLGKRPITLYTNAGICQLRFAECRSAAKPYGQRGALDGKYQDQGHAVPAR